MKVEVIRENKKRYIDLLLLADEQESMIDRYLERGTMFALYEDGLKAVCVVTDEGEGVCELKNIATDPSFQGKGYGRALVDYVCDQYKEGYSRMIVGTGDSPLTIPFYQKCGFTESHRAAGFFTEHYDHPIFEAGRQLVDMVYLKKNLKEAAGR